MKRTFHDHLRGSQEQGLYKYLFGPWSGEPRAGSRGSGQCQGTFFSGGDQRHCTHRGGVGWGGGRCVSLARSSDLEAATQRRGAQVAGAGATLFTMMGVTAGAIERIFTRKSRVKYEAVLTGDPPPHDVLPRFPLGSLDAAEGEGGGAPQQMALR